jgi:hypothetical protein
MAGGQRRRGGRQAEAERVRRTAHDKLSCAAHRRSTAMSAEHAIDKPTAQHNHAARCVLPLREAKKAELAHGAPSRKLELQCASSPSRMLICKHRMCLPPRRASAWSGAHTSAHGGSATQCGGKHAAAMGYSAPHSRAPRNPVTVLRSSSRCTLLLPPRRVRQQRAVRAESQRKFQKTARRGESNGIHSGAGGGGSERAAASTHRTSMHAPGRRDSST